MNKIFKTILIILALAPFAFAHANDNLVVQFEQAPLFNEANFLPGEGVTRWVKVTNNSEVVQRIATQPLNIIDPNRLGDVLNLEIKEGGTTLYNKPLSTFFSGGEEFLSNLASGNTAQYDFIISFYPGARNTFQGKSLGFDILIGFQGTEGGILPGAGSTSGYGGSNGPPGGLPPGLSIYNESVASTTPLGSALISWTTSYYSTSQVVYGIDTGAPYNLDLTAPNFGYPNATVEDSAKVINHAVEVTGLILGKTYRYRAVSHASPPTISFEHTFTMPTEEEFAGRILGSVVQVSGVAPGQQASAPEVSGAGEAIAPTLSDFPVREVGVPTPEVVGKETEKTEGAEAKEFSRGMGSLAASFFGISEKWSGLFDWLLLILFFLLVIFLIWHFQKKKKGLR
ncbi:hypothetical protein L6251_02820 [Candidatus Parcubacteria bacterium]|nr:hypothetical protein [Patescibacteria group bacterium]MCG2699321.1 hypothetical protein [Candidatus Parcubacteria bacterium]